MEPGLVGGWGSAKGTGKILKSCLVVLSVFMVLCVDDIFVTLLILLALCKGYCHPAMVCGISPAFSFDLVTCCMIGKEQTARVFGFEKLLCYYFLSSMLVLLSTSPCITATYHGPPGQFQHILAVKMHEKSPVLSVFFFSGDGWCWEKKMGKK